MGLKIVRGLLYLLAALVALAALLALLLTHDGFVRQLLNRQVSNSTGWQLSIAGGFEIDWGRQTRIHARQLDLQNLHWAHQWAGQWAEQAQMFQAEELVLLWQPLALWDGELIIDDLRISHCNAHYLERGEQSNWQPGKANPNLEDNPAPADDSADFGWQLHNLVLADCRITVRRERHQKALEIELEEAQLQSGADQVLQASLRGALAGQALSVRGTVNPVTALWQGGMLHHDLTARAGQVVLQSSGTIADFEFGDGADLQLRFTGPEFHNVTEWLGWPDLGSGPFDAELSLDEQAAGLTGYHLKGDFGDLQVNSSGHLDRLVKPQNGAVDLRISGPDLGAVGELLEQHWLIHQAFDFTLQADLEQGRTEILTLMLNAGENRVAAQGVLGPWPLMGPAMAGSNIKATLHSPDLARWQPAGWEPVHLFGQLDATIGLKVDDREELDLEILGRLGENRFSVVGSLGQGSLGLRPAGEDPSASIALDSASLQQFALLFGQQDWPDLPFNLKGKLCHTDAGVQLQQIQLQMAGDTLDLEGQVVLGEGYRGSQIKADLKLADLAATGQRFGLPDLPAQPLNLSSTLQRQGRGLKFDISDGALAGIRIRMKGDIPDIQQPLVMNSTLDLSLPSARMAGFLLPRNSGLTDLPDLPLTAKGALVNSGSAMRLRDFTIQLGQHHASLEGELLTGKNHVGSRAQLRATGRDIRELWPGSPPELDLGAYRLSANWLRKADGDHLQDLRAELGVANLAASGKLTDANHRPAFGLDFALDSNDASQFNVFTGQPLSAEPLALKFRLEGEPARLQFRSLDMRLGKSDLTGQLQLEYNTGPANKATRPRLSGKLLSKQFDATPWQRHAREESLREKQRASAQPGAKSSSAPARQARQMLFPNEPFNLVQDSPLDLDLDLQVDQFLLEGTRFRQIKLGLDLDSQSLRLQPFELLGEQGGSYQGRLASVRQGSRSTLDLEVNASSLKLGFVGTFGLDPDSLPASDIVVKLTGLGGTWHELAQSLNGRLRWYQGPGSVSKSGLNFMFSDFLTELLNTLNPMAQKSDLTHLACSVFAADVVNGKVAVAPIIYQTDQVTGFSEGTVDLASEAIDLNFHTVARKGLGLSAGAVVNPFFKIGGTLVKPALHLDVTKGAISGSVMVATAGLSVLFKSFSDRLLSSKDPCGDARRELEKRDSG
jgi:hypothetical protein